MPKWIEYQLSPSTIARDAKSTNKRGLIQKERTNQMFKLQRNEERKWNELYSRIFLNFINIRDSDLHEIY